MGESNKTKVPNAMNFVLGGTAGMLATCIVQPNDLTKTRMQLQSSSSKQVYMLSQMGEIMRAEGILGFYNGLSAALFRQATYTTTRMGIFNTLMAKYKSVHGDSPNMGAKLLMGCISGGTGAFVGTPAEVCLIRMTADGRLPPEQRRNYTSVFNAINRIVKGEGMLGLWRGASATVTRAMIVNGFQLSTYSEAREILQPRLGEGTTLHFYAAMISGFMTSVASAPVDIIKTRVQNSTTPISQAAAIKEIAAKEGVLAFWKGFLPTYLKIGPHTVLTFIFLEQLNMFYVNMFSE